MNYDVSLACYPETATAPYTDHIHTIFLNRLTPNDPYMGHTAPLTSKRCILYIYSTNIGTEYFKHASYSPFFFSSKCTLFHNANFFGSSIIHILYTECAKIKKIIPGQRVKHLSTHPLLYASSTLGSFSLHEWVKEIRYIYLMRNTLTRRYWCRGSMSCILNFNNKLQEVPRLLCSVEPFVIWNAILPKVQINFLVIMQSIYKTLIGL